MSTAKKWAFGTYYEILPQRPPLFPFLAFLLYKVGFSEIPIKFLLEIIPTFLSVLFFYFLIKEMYDKKTALIASFILSVSWIHLFYSMRFMTDSISFLFGIIAFFFFWKGYVLNKGRGYVWLIGPLVALSFLSRLIGILYGMFIFLFLILTDRFKFLKNKHVWLSLLLFALTISPYLLWSHSYYGNAFAFRSGYGDVQGYPLGWNFISLVYDYPELGFFIFFILGLLTLIPMFLGVDILLLKRDKTHYADFFMFLSMLFTLAFFIYFLRVGENRWLILMSIGIFAVSAKGIVLIYSFVNKNVSKILAIILLLAILFSGAYFQLKHADAIIKSKINSYYQVKEAALWMKSNSNSSDIIISASLPQTIYYSERKVILFLNPKVINQAYTQEEFTELIKKLRPKFFVTSVFEPWVPQWTYNYTQQYPEQFKPVKAWFADAEQKQPILIIYEFTP